MKKIYLIMLLTVCTFSLQAKHIAGGDFYSTWISGNNFQITLKLFRDCSDPTGAQFDPSITVAVYRQGSSQFVQSFEMYLGNVRNLSLVGDLCSPPPSVCMQEGTFESIITLPTYSQGYYLVWERCCRNASIINIANVQNAAMAFYLEIPNPALQNSSPVFMNEPLPYMCIDQPWTFNFNAVDIDGDNLVYYFDTPLDGGHSSSQDPNPFSNATQSGGGGQIPPPAPYYPTIWANGYSNSNIVDGNPTLQINSSTGQLTCTPNSLGMYAMAVVVEEYRNGILIGRVRRELEFVVIDCNQNQAPAFATNIAPKVGNLYEVYATDTLCLSLTITDSEDSIVVTHEGDCFPGGIAVGPFAVTQDSAGFKKIKLDFCWTTTCDHIAAIPYHVKYTATDNGCPLPKIKILEFNILVKAPPAVDAVNLLCMKHVSNDVLQVYYGDSSSIPVKFFRYFLVYRSVNGSAFSVVDTVFNKSINYFTDSTATNNSVDDYCYFLVGVNSCGNTGLPSDTLCSISSLNYKLNYVATTTVAAPNEISVNWKNFPDAPFSIFYIFRKENDVLSQFGLYNTLQFPATDYTVDKNVLTTEKSYCYYVTNEDVCGNISQPSNIGCSILLQGESKPFVNKINWTAYEKWDGGVDYYEIWRQNDDQSPYIKIATTNNSTFLYTDVDLDITGGRFAYKIIAYEGAGSLNEKSTSNEIVLIQSPQVFIPNAFTPNDDSYNETWAPKSVFVKDFDLHVFNRWGQEIFASQSETQQWNGQYKSKPCPQGVYFYVLKFTGYDGPTTYTKTGSVTIIR